MVVEPTDFTERVSLTMRRAVRLCSLRRIGRRASHRVARALFAVAFWMLSTFFVRVRKPIARSDKASDELDNTTSKVGIPPQNIQIDGRREYLWGEYFRELPRVRPRNTPTVSIVISHCKEPLDWVEETTAGLRVKKLTIYSKCGVSPSQAPASASVIKLPNVGRCDHTYARHMATISDEEDQSEVLVFMTDTHRRDHHQKINPRPLVDVVEEANGLVGFGCGEIPFASGLSASLHGLSLWHLTSEVEKFNMDNYVADAGYVNESFESFETNTSLSNWWHDLDLHMPKPIMPICYSGYFAAKVASILPRRPVLSQIYRSLERGDNIIEGHYAERTFAALLLPPLNYDAMKEPFCSPFVAVRECRRNEGYCGMLRNIGMGTLKDRLYLRENHGGNLGTRDLREACGEISWKSRGGAALYEGTNYPQHVPLMRTPDRASARI